LISTHPTALHLARVAVLLVLAPKVLQILEEVFLPNYLVLSKNPLDTSTTRPKRR